MPDIALADLGEPAFAEFVTAHLSDIAPTAPSDSQHAYGLAELRGLAGRIWVARSAGRIVGMAALAPLDGAREELKSMRTDPRHRRQGIASSLMSTALDDAAGRGVGQIMLETGSMDFFAAARSLYLKFGFRFCEPFGSYGQDPNSVFMQLHLARRPNSRVGRLGHGRA